MTDKDRLQYLEVLFALSGILDRNMDADEGDKNKSDSRGCGNECGKMPASPL